MTVVIAARNAERDIADSVLSTFFAAEILAVENDSTDDMVARAREAGASGVPSVTGDSGGLRLAAGDGETGLVVPPEKIDRVTAALRLPLTDDDLRRMVAAARRAVVTHYNWDRAARDTLGFVRDVTGGRGRIAR